MCNNPSLKQKKFDPILIKSVTKIEELIRSDSIFGQIVNISGKVSDWSNGYCFWLKQTIRNEKKVHDLPEGYH